MYFEYIVNIKNNNMIEIDIREINSSFLQLFLPKGNSITMSDEILELVIKSGMQKIMFLYDHTENGILITIPISKNVTDIEVKYKIPYCVEIGRRNKKIVKVTNEYIYASLNYVLFVPIDLCEQDECNLDIIWPEEWKGTIRYLNRIYKYDDIFNSIILGGKNVNTYDFENIHIAALLSDKNMPFKMVYNSIKYLENTLNIFINKEDEIFANIICDTSIHGGISTGFSFLAENDKFVISHELVHIWIGNIIKFDIESSWIKEGITEYLSQKMLYKIGEMHTKEYFSYVEEKYSSVSKKRMKYNLIEVSPISFGSLYSLEKYNIVYNAGMLVTIIVDASLRENGFSIEQILHMIYKERKIINTEIYLNYILGHVKLEKYNEIENIISGKKVFPEWKVFDNLLRNYVL